MQRSYFALILVSVGSVALFLVTSLPSVAASFSGRVVDESGVPVSGVTVALLPQKTETDEIGAFSMTDVAPSSVTNLMLLPVHRAEYEIRAVEIEGVTFYFDPLRHNWYNNRFPIAIAPGADVKDVEIIVRLRMRIRGRVLSADGTPLRDAEVQFEINQRSANGRRTGSSSGPRNLDAEGYFVEYVEEPAFYTFTIAYQGQFAESKKILLEDGQRLDGLALTLSDDPDEHAPSKAVVKPVFKPAVLAAPEPPVKPKVIIPPRAYDPQSAEAAQKREREGMWAINPDNRHAYKVIHCKTREEAETRAKAQGAYLVAINDAAEQHWLLEVFGQKSLLNDETEQAWHLKAFSRESHWIGLTDKTKEGNLYWDNGEPLTYTNWGSPEKIVEDTVHSQNDDANQHYTVLIGRTGKWQMVRQGSSIAGLIEKAILEKENFIAGTSE
ncbi:MAG: lectin-like protein [Candidatus Poribacteria bacterium]|nr:lectin-like protein [Candidatus Poribacteria bacterium]